MFLQKAAQKLFIRIAIIAYYVVYLVHLFRDPPNDFIWLAVTATIALLQYQIRFTMFISTQEAVLPQASDENIRKNLITWMI
ncbi:unnamed protein product [Rhizophagus irregularis]|nr:unnamed protein product [Rhizophagus irregularis]CAB5182834.1 unnamed protein product [Rhizophagus irregularis]